MTNSDRHIRLLVIVVFATVFAVNIRPLELSDFWWHLATGRWIVQNGQLPQSDPFSYTVGVPVGLKMAILKGYWLAQVLMYGVFKAFGLKGIVVFRAVLFTSIYAMLYIIVRGRGLNRAASMFLVLSIMPAMKVFMAMKPKIFSFVLAIAVFYLLDRFREDKGASYKNRWLLIALPLIMLLWSNMHGGYIIGVGMTSIFLCFETYDAVKRGADKRFKVLAVMSAVSILASGLNPIGFRYLGSDMIHALINRGGVPQMDTLGQIVEFLSIFDYYKLTGNMLHLSWVMGFNALLLVSFLLNHRNFNPFRAVMGAIFMAASILSFRYGPYLMFISTILIAGNTNQCGKSICRWLGQDRMLEGAVAALVTMPIVLSAMWPVSWETLGDKVPTKAAAFIRYNAPPREIFASYVYGSYMTWALYPEYRTFIDGRILDDRIYRTFNLITGAGSDTDGILKGYGVNTVFLYTLAPLDRGIPLLFYLMQSDKWQPVYFDDVSTVFTRKGTGGPTAIDPSSIWNFMLSVAKSKPGARGHYLQGEVYFRMGRMAEAREAFLNVQRLMPGEPRSLNYLSVMGIN